MAVDALITLASVLTVPFLIHRLGVDGYALIGLVGVLTAQLAFVQTANSQATTRRAAEVAGREGSSQAYAVLGASKAVAAVTASMVLAAFLVFGPWALTRGGKTPAGLASLALEAVLPGAISAAAQALYLAPLAFILAEQRFGTLSLLRAGQGLGRPLAAVFVVSLGGSVPHILWAQVIVDAVSLAGAWWAAGGPSWNGFSAVGLATEAKALGRLGAPFALMNAIIGFLGDAEKIVIAAVRTLEDFTYYSIPYNATVRLSGISGALAGNLIPRLAFTGAAAGDAAVAELTRRATRIVLGLATALVCPLIAILPEVYSLWLGAGFVRYATTPGRLLLMTLLAGAAASAPNATLRARARPEVLALIYGLQVPFYAGVLYALVSGWGIRGAAIAVLLRTLVDLALQRVAAARALSSPLGGLTETVWCLVAAGALLAACEWMGPGLSAGARLLAGCSVGALVIVGLYSARDWQTLKEIVPWGWLSQLFRPNRR